MSSSRRTALTVALTLLAVAVIAGVYIAGRASRSSPHATSASSTTSASTTSAIPTTSTSAPTPIPDLLGLTDPDESHWAPSRYEQPQRIQARLFSAEPMLINEFPVTMNGCDRRQMRVSWRSLHTSVTAGIAPFTDRGRPVVFAQRLPDKRTAGTMWLGGCEQPAFIGPGDIEDLVVEVSVYEPAAGFSTAPALPTVTASPVPACAEDEVHAVIQRSGAVAEGASFTIRELTCDSGWAWGAVHNPDFGGAVFILTATGDHWTLVDLGSAICPTKEGMPTEVAARIVPPGEADCG